MSPDLCTLILKCTHQAQLLQIQSHLTTSGLISSVFIVNTLIRAHSKTPCPHHAIPLYSHLLRSSFRPDTHTLTFLIKACSLIPSFPTGLSAHAHAFHLGLASHLFTANALIHFYSSTGDVPSACFILQGIPAPDPVSYNSMISGYVKAGDIASARELFDEMPQRNSITWTAMIAGYVQCGLSKEALLLFSLMQADRFRLNDSTMTSVLAACAHTGALEQGEWVHGYLRSSEVEISVFLGSALIDMYAKCRKVDLGLEVFRNMRERNLLVWTIMIKEFQFSQVPLRWRHQRPSDSPHTPAQPPDPPSPPSCAALIASLSTSTTTDLPTYQIRRQGGRPLPPSDETCYPLSSAGSVDCSSGSKRSAYDPDTADADRYGRHQPGPQPAYSFHPQQEAPAVEYGRRP